MQLPFLEQQIVNNLTICGLREANIMKEYASNILSIENERTLEYMHFKPSPHQKHLIIDLEGDDVDECENSKIDKINKALNFARENNNKLLIHCFAGVNRSTAISLAVITDILGIGSEMDSVELLRFIRPISRPNLTIVMLADRILHRNGELVRATFKGGLVISKSYRLHN